MKEFGEIPLIAALPVPARPGSAGNPLSARQLYIGLKGCFKKVARSAASEHPEATDKLHNASTHWLRHTFASHGIYNGMTLDTIRDLLGHKFLSTTSVYITTEKDKRILKVEKLGDLAAF